TDQNKRALLSFWTANPELAVDRNYQSYVISDNRRRIVFNTAQNGLTLEGEPSYYFWRMKNRTPAQIRTAEEQVRQELIAQLEAVSRGTNPDAKVWLQDQLIQEAKQY